MQWIVDGYTTLPRYPYAQQVDLGQATSDSLRPATPAGSAGYMRNSVKATVDAYSGEVHLYAVDEQDPVLRTWMGAFPASSSRRRTSRRPCGRTSGTRRTSSRSSATC